MTINNLRQSALACAIWICLCLTPGAQAQITASGSITENTLDATVGITTLPSVGAASMASVSTPSGSMTCTTYPQLTLYDTRNGTQLDLADITTSSGTLWQVTPNFTQLESGDTITAELTQAGVSCTNELPLTVTLTYSLAAGICYAQPNACVVLTGSFAAANGINSGNLILTFTPTQLAMLAGVLPPSQTGTPGTYPYDVVFALPGQINAGTGTPPGTSFPIETFDRVVTFPANFSGSAGTTGVGGAPTSQAVFTFYDTAGTMVSGQCVSSGTPNQVGTVTIATSGLFTFATSGGAAFAANVCDTLSVTVPAAADPTLNNVSFSLLWSRL